MWWVVITAVLTAEGAFLIERVPSPSHWFLTERACQRMAARVEAEEVGARLAWCETRGQDEYERQHPEWLWPRPIVGR